MQKVERYERVCIRVWSRNQEHWRRRRRLREKKDAFGSRHVQFGAFIGCPHWWVSE